jgi:hypothetical protein
LQTQKATAPFSCFVENLEQPHSHKEERLFLGAEAAFSVLEHSYGS